MADDADRKMMALSVAAINVMAKLKTLAYAANEGVVWDTISECIAEIEEAKNINAGDEHG